MPKLIFIEFASHYEEKKKLQCVKLFQKIKSKNIFYGLVLATWIGETTLHIFFSKKKAEPLIKRFEKNARRKNWTNQYFQTQPKKKKTREYAIYPLQIMSRCMFEHRRRRIYTRI